MRHVRSTSIPLNCSTKAQRGSRRNSEAALSSFARGTRPFVRRSQNLPGNRRWTVGIETVVVVRGDEKLPRRIADQIR